MHLLYIIYSSRKSSGLEGKEQQRAYKLKCGDLGIASLSGSVLQRRKKTRVKYEARSYQGKKTACLSTQFTHTETNGVNCMFYSWRVTELLLSKLLLFTQTIKLLLLVLLPKSSS